MPSDIQELYDRLEVEHQRLVKDGHGACLLFGFVQVVFSRRRSLGLGFSTASFRRRRGLRMSL